MNILLSLQLELRSQHLLIEELLNKVKNDRLSKDEILSYENALKEDVYKLDEINNIIKSEELSCFSNK